MTAVTRQIRNGYCYAILKRESKSWEWFNKSQVHRLVRVIYRAGYTVRPRAGMHYYRKNLDFLMAPVPFLDLSLCSCSSCCCCRLLAVSTILAQKSWTSAVLSLLPVTTRQALIWRQTTWPLWAWKVRWFLTRTLEESSSILMSHRWTFPPKSPLAKLLPLKPKHLYGRIGIGGQIKAARKSWWDPDKQTRINVLTCSSRQSSLICVRSVRLVLLYDCMAYIKSKNDLNHAAIWGD